MFEEAKKKKEEKGQEEEEEEERRMKLLGFFRRERAMNDGQYMEEGSVIGQAFGRGQRPV